MNAKEKAALTRRARRAVAMALSRWGKTPYVLHFGVGGEASTSALLPPGSEEDAAIRRELNRAARLVGSAK